MNLCFVITCRGRLDSLQKTINSVIKQGCDIVIVDYDCPQGCGIWVEAMIDPKMAKVVRVEHRRYFNLSDARNIGAAAAVDAEWLAFIDADTLLNDDFIKTLGPALEHGVFYNPQFSQSLGGTLVVEKTLFDRVGGYDSVMQGWGNEDTEIVFRLARAGGIPCLFPNTLMKHLDHDHDARVCHYELKDPRVSYTINKVYAIVKHDILGFGQQFELDLEQRQELYDKVKTMYITARNKEKAVLGIEAPPADVGEYVFKRTLAYQLREKKSVPKS